MGPFSRAARQSLEDERDRLLRHLNDNVTWAFITLAKFAGARSSIAHFPPEVKRGLYGDLNCLEQQISEIAVESQALTARIRLDRQVKQAQPDISAAAEQRSQIVASFPRWADVQWALSNPGRPAEIH